MSTLSRLNVSSAVLSSLLILQGCVVAPERSSLDGSSVGQASARQAPELDNLSEGDTVVFYEGLLAPLGQVTIGREYHAASGRLCKRILNATGQQLVSVACRTGQSQWYMREALNGKSVAQQVEALKAKATDKNTLVPAQEWEGKDLSTPASDDVSYRLEQDETLWSFSKRTTGNALNWQAIAQYNDVVNESALKAGTSIRIPAALHQPGR